MRNPVRSAFAIVAVLCELCGTTPALAQGRCAMPVARVVEAVGVVSVPGPPIINIAAGSQLDLCAGETVATGPRSRATVALIASNQHLRINQNTTIRIVVEMPQAPRSVIELLQGIIRLFNPIGRQLDVRTPFVTAGTEGTEFFVAYDPQTEETRAGVIEGLVRVTRGADFVTLDAGQAAVAPRVGPLQRLDIVPADAVRWSIFYPPAMWNLPPQEEMALDPRVASAWQAWRGGDLRAFAEALNSIPPILPPPAVAPLDPRSLLRLAALLLIVGQVEEAEAAVAQAALTNATAPLIPALRAIIAVARNRTEDALALSESAVAASRQGSDQAAVIGAAIARSYALQSAFRLPEAREILETVESADDPLVFARLAELDLSLGNNRAARREAQRANQLAPSLSLTSSILGFAALANFESAAARTAFERAATQNPGDPLPHLGLGLVAIRSGRLLSFGSANLEEGRRELVIAVALDPENSVARSYAGRTYAELRLYPDAFREWALAETADPNDPTAPLYRAFAERALNRPIEALRDIERSIALNDNRAVYRSRLLLDQDLATRTTDLASVYRDLNFEQLALSEGYKSVDVDPANPGAHRFLSDTYLALPRHETASDSELLQSLLLQPINVQPLRPRLARDGLGILDLGGPSRVGFNEFSPVFASNGLSVLADAFGGTQGTYGDNFVLSGIHDKFSFSVGQFYYRTEGIRPNNDLRRDIENALVQVALSDRASLFAEYRHSGLKSGDLNLGFYEYDFDPYSRWIIDARQYRLGGRFDVAPGLTFVGVWTREDRNDSIDPLAAETHGDFGEGAF
jgi:tetratricopeptide (TPR) repeat protein